MELTTEITEIKGVGPALAKKFHSLGIKSVGDLIDYYPRRYDDFSNVQTINQIKPGPVTIQVTIKQAKGRYVRRGMHITEAVASDQTGSVKLVWFNQPYRAAALKSNAEYYVSGEFGLKAQHFNIQNPSVELVSDFPVNTARIVPIYKETKGLKSAQIRKILRNCVMSIRQMPETLPSWVIDDHKLLSFAKSLETVHFPDTAEALKKAKHRLAFEEVFTLSLSSLLNKQDLLDEPALKIEFDEKLAKQFVNNLPFKLTDSQRKAIWQIYLDIQKTTPMNRLLEGDVGSGKTVVAVMAAVMAMKHKFQVALMAPTEILARQHAETVHSLLKPLGMADQVVLLVGGLKPKQKAAAQASIASGRALFIVGTHALIQEKVDIKKLNLLIVDEQHRFGVEQRKQLQKRTGHIPHMLNMTATPIPRSLALTLYGEMDITLLEAKPIGRKPIITKIVSPNSRPQLYEKIEQQLQTGRQVFVVTPLISESDAMPIKSAEEVYKDLNTKIFKNWRVGLLHGKLKADEKESIMQKFVDHELDVLVSTTVIEVGVDVPNATVMLIENAERFGLAQIHQLRGRVGRSNHQGYCYLMLGDSKPPSRRLRALEQTNDGFVLAELDLEIRGPGAIYGVSQHGQLDLRMAKLTDVKLIQQAKKAAEEFIDKNEKLVKYKQLESKVQKLRSITILN